MLSLFRKHLNIKIAIIAVAIFALIITGFSMRKGNKSVYDTVIAKKGELVQKVSVTGKIKPAESVDLAFENSGKVSYAPLSVGDMVSRGQILVRLDNSDVYALLLQAQANLDVEKATLEEYLKGTRVEEIAVYKIKLENKKIALFEANKDLIDKISDAFTKSDDAVRNMSDRMFSNPQSDSPTLDFNVSSQLKIDIENKRLRIEGMLKEWEGNINTDSVRKNAPKVKNYLKQTKEFLDKLSLAVNTLLSTSTVTQATIDGYKSDISTARNNINIAISNLTTSGGRQTAAVSAVSLAEQELLLKQSGKTAEQISVQKARVKSAEANVANLNARISKRILRAPIGGVITKQDAKVGEIVSVGAVVVSLISPAMFEIKTNIPEVDIANIIVGNEATLTLDAYGEDDIFKASVYTIDPAETVIEGVSTYEVTLRFTDDSGRVRSGMTANIDILTNTREGAIAIPARAISNKKDGSKSVKILLDDGSVKEKSISTGLRGYDGRIEIIDGISEGDEIIIFELE